MHRIKILCIPRLIISLDVGKFFIIPVVLTRHRGLHFIMNKIKGGEEMDQKDQAYQLIEYLPKESRSYIHEQAFIDIAHIFLKLASSNKDRTNGNLHKNPVRWVCNASMGHGKTEVLKAFLKHLIAEHSKEQIPVLISVREKELGQMIFEELHRFKQDCVVMVDAENKKEVINDIPDYPIVIITHVRLENLALEFEGEERKKEFAWSLFKGDRYVGTCEFVPPAERAALAQIAQQFVQDEDKDWIYLEPLIRFKR